jgi:hypothetical protein
MSLRSLFWINTDIFYQFIMREVSLFKKERKKERIADNNYI